MARAVGKIGKSGGIWRIAGWGMAGLILLLPLAAMQVTDEVKWDGADFTFAAVMIGGVGLAFELAVRMSKNIGTRGGVGAALAAAFLIVWANAAVGMIGDGDNPLNLMFAGVLALAFLGAVLVRFQPERMAVVMTVAAVAQLVAGAVGASTDLRGGILSACFAGPWILSAALFAKAGRERTTGSI